MSEQWLSIVEYARKNNVSDMTVRRRIKSGKIDAVLRDGKYYINPSAQKASSHSPHQTPQFEPVEKPQPRSRPLVIPSHLRAGFNPQSQTPTPDPNSGTAALLNFCENALKRSEQAESRLGDKYESQLSQLKERLSHKESTIEDLNQQVHDLKVLVELLEKDY